MGKRKGAGDRQEATGEAFFEARLPLNGAEKGVIRESEASEGNAA
jgi:hypothetical protein